MMACSSDSTGLMVDDDGGAGGSGGGTAGSVGDGGVRRDGAAGSTGGTGGTGGSAAVTWERACDQVSKFCERLNSCAPFLIKLVYGDMATCTARARLGCVQNIGARGVTAMPADFVTCMNAAGAASCTDLLNNRFGGCVLKGSLMNGVGCAINSQCGTGFCRRGGGTMCGVCGPKSAAGGSCAQDNEECDLGLICKNKRCVATVALGATCDDAHACESPLYCKAGICANPVAVGEACTVEGSCNGLQGQFCNAQKICQVLGTATVGQPCGLGLTPPTVCAASASCQPNAARGTCAATAGDGEACSATRPCLSPATCVSGACKLPSPAMCN